MLVGVGTTVLPNVPGSEPNPTITAYVATTRDGNSGNRLYLPRHRAALTLSLLVRS